jgi:transposase
MNQSTLPIAIAKEKPQTRVIQSYWYEGIRVKKPIRNQAEMLVRDLNSLLAEDHAVRAIWDFLNKLDLSAFYSSIKVVLDQPGRPASDPQVLLALWVYATVEGIGSARRLARLSEEHDVYRWLRGGVPIDYHLLAEFRVTHQKEIDDLITQIIAALLKAEVIELKRVSQDGIRVRASAGVSSFHREKTLKKCFKEAREQVQRVAEEREHPDKEISQREQAARERAARERQERIEEALRQLPQVQAIKERQKKHAGKTKAAKVKEARVSTTDPSARNMKMADGGFRPAYNVQFATDTQTQVIVGVDVTKRGTDQGEAHGMEEQVERRTGKQPQDYLVDGGFVDLQDIKRLEQKGIRVYAPPKDNGGKEVSNQKGPAGSPEVAAWRARMKIERSQTVYKERAATSECVNALMRARYGLEQFTVRGDFKILGVALLMALAHNLLRWIKLTKLAA